MMIACLFAEFKASERVASHNTLYHGRVRKMTLRMLSIACGISLCAAMGARADTIAVNFETYPTGPIVNGYDGWQITNPAWDQAVVSSGAISGTQSWRMSRLLASGSFGDQPFSPALAELAGEVTPNKLFTASWVMQATTVTAVTGDGLSIAMDNGTGARGNQIRVVGASGAWQIIVDDYDGTAFTTTSLGTLSSTIATKISWSMLFVPGADNDVWKVSVDDVLVYTGIGWEEYFRDFQPGISPVSYDRLLFRAGGPSIAGATGILIDDITYSSIPEPATIALMTLGLAGLGALRRRRTAV